MPISTCYLVPPLYVQRVYANAGEKLWQLPLEDDYWENCKSPIADMSNIGGRFGGAITAALFLKEYVDTEKVPLLKPLCHMCSASYLRGGSASTCLLT